MDTQNIQAQKGFTLVELAIVLTIIGLLIGGILKGQQLMQNSRVTATVAQINGFEAAVTSFRDAYGELPGDLSDAQNRIPGCSGNWACDISGTGGEPGNGKIGIVNWDLITFQGSGLGGATAALAGATAIHAETILFWYELQQSGLITAVTDEGLTNTAADSPTFEGSFPAAKVGGGWWVGNISGVDTASTELTDVVGRVDPLPPLGTSLIMVAKPNPDWGDDAGVAGAVAPTDMDKQPLLPAVAAQMDRKIDDGHPFTGQVHAYGGSDATTPAGPGSCVKADSYNESNVSKDCGLILRIQR